MLQFVRNYNHAHISIAYGVVIFGLKMIYVLGDLMFWRARRVDE
ncbi:hypothetical protein [Mucilaginibacter gossypii]|nr:hypothetical protein [Mucilaginibacter gossypii]